MSIRIVAGNTDWAKRGDGKYLAHLAQTCDVIATQESKDTDLHAVAKTLPRGPWTAIQDTSDDAHKGSGLLVRDAAAKVVNRTWHLGVNPYLRGRRIKMLARYILAVELHTADGSTLYVLDAHNAPTRFSPLQIPYRRRLKALAGQHHRTVVATDANQSLTVLAKYLGMKPHGRGIVGLITGSRVKVTSVAVSEWGIRNGYTDHPSVAATCTVLPPLHH